MTDMMQLQLQGNCFTGTLPSLNEMKLLEEIFASENCLTGPVGNKLNHLRLLSVVELQSNRFTGSLEYLVDPSEQNLTSIVDLSSNQFSSTLPSKVFQLLHLQYFAVEKNCFTGSIPQSVCDRNQTLRILALDGMHTASTCQNKILPSSDTYSLDAAIQGSIPCCLFKSMRSLNTLHLSGNGLQGSLPSDINMISPQLTQLSLSHNKLTGTIPVTFQLHGWIELDLAYNKFTGELLSTFNVSMLLKQEMNER